MCEEEQCQSEVFPLAMNMLDRFLAVVKIRKNQLQLLGSVCLLIASKLRQSRPIEPRTLIRYTDWSITLDEIIVSVLYVQLDDSSSHHFTGLGIAGFEQVEMGCGGSDPQRLYISTTAASAETLADQRPKANPETRAHFDRLLLSR